MSDILDLSDEHSHADAIEKAALAIRNSELVVLPTDTVYGVGADAFSPQAVAVLLAAKGRNRSMPPPVLIPTMSTMQALAVDLPPVAQELAQMHWPGPLTIIVRAQATLQWDLGETHGTVALRMPNDPVALELLQATGPLAVSSANRTGRPAATTAQQAHEQLADSVRYYLDAGERNSQSASTIVDLTGEPLVVRQGPITVDF